MRAARLARYGSPREVEIREVPPPVLRPHDLLVRVHAAALNPVDVKIRAGYMRAVVRPRLPFTPGMDLSGVVEAVGPAVTRFSVGDAVFGSPSHKTMGSWAELARIDEAEAALKPASIDHVQAASLPLVALTAWDSLVRRGPVRNGQRVLIQAGAGGVGTIAIQLAKHLGAQVLATCSAGNIDLVRSLGADVVIDYKAEQYDAVAQGCDLIVESIGPDHFDRALKTLRRRGTLVVLSSGLPEAAVRLGPWLGALRTGLRLASLILRAGIRHGVRVVPITRKADGHALEQVARLVDAGALKPVIDSVFSLEKIVEAQTRLESGHCRGKVVLDLRPA